MKIAIFGVGLIGGSLALCFKGKPGIHVVGHSNTPESAAKYLQRGVVDSATTSMEEAACDADFIFLCVPVGSIGTYLHKLSHLSLKSGCIITDVGSTKSQINECAKGVQLNGAYFIGGHPMAGSERSGVEAATSHLFENAFYVLTPDQNVPETAYHKLADLLKYTRAQIIRVDAREHDDIVGAISHLPHIIAVALVNQIAACNEQNDLYQRLAAGGFRDITRIASSDPVIWRDILLQNREVLLKLLHDWNEQISHFTRLLSDMDGEGIAAQFHAANAFRSKLPENRKGIIQSRYDIYVDIPDQPGIIAQITKELSDKAISLSNIQIYESRVDVPGVLRLSFRDERDMDKARDILEKLNYSIHF